MTVVEIIGLLLALLLMGVGTIGCLVPGLPGTPMVLIAAIAHRLYFENRSSSTLVLLLIAGLTLLSIVVDYLATIYGARKLGATWRGATGAAVGGVVGLFFSIPGILLGPFVGATLGELCGARPLSEAAKAGLGATIGIFAGGIGKLACCFVMGTLFLGNVLWRTFH